MAPNDDPKLGNIDKISTPLHVYYLNVNVNLLKAVQIARIQAHIFECTPCSDAISGPKERVFDIKSATSFKGIETLSRLFIFRSMIYARWAT